MECDDEMATRWAAVVRERGSVLLIEFCNPWRVGHLSNGVEVESAAPQGVTGEGFIVGVPEAGDLTSDDLDNSGDDVSTRLLYGVDYKEQSRSLGTRTGAGAPGSGYRPKFSSTTVSWLVAMGQWKHNRADH